MNQIFYDAVGNNPIIAAVKNMKDIEVSCTIEEIQVIFILFGDVCSIDRIVKRVKDAGKVAMVHVDLISGLSPKEVSVEYLKEHTEADGIISTKPSLIKKAKELGMYTILRYFLLDSMAFENIRQQQHIVRPDFIEVLPSDAKSDQKNLQFDKDTDHSRRTDHRQRRCDGCIISRSNCSIIDQSSGMEDVMAAYDETEYLIAYGEQFK